VSLHECLIEVTADALRNALLFINPIGRHNHYHLSTSFFAESKDYRLHIHKNMRSQQKDASQKSYRGQKMISTGIEPVPLPWKGKILPLNYDTALDNEPPTLQYILLQNSKFPQVFTQDALPSQQP
jgi:hypothetical protein